MEEQEPRVPVEEPNASDPEGASGGPREAEVWVLPKATDPELIVGLVTPVGTRTENVAERIRTALTRWNYKSHVIKLSKFFDGTEPPLDEAEDARIKRLIAAGNAFCRKNGSDPSAIAKLAALAIRADRLALHRQAGTAGNDDELMGKPVPRHAYILHSLKRPAEFDLLRELYGSQFLLVGCQGSREQRVGELMKRPLGATEPGAREALARELMAIDASESDPLGQKVNSLYPRAHFFLGWEEDATRFVDLLFGDPLTGPKQAEVAMYMAHAAGVQTLALSRRVGAAISLNGSVVSIGCNEVPPGEEPDIIKGEDFSQRLKVDILQDALERLTTLLNAEALAFSKEELTAKASELLDESHLMDIIEYQRPVHAEAAAVADAGRRGQTVEGASLYCTTYPCHLCFKGLLSVGIKEVFYIDPYPKSRAVEMFPEHAYRLKPYEGLHPRSYMRVFEDRETLRAGPDGRVGAPGRDTAQPIITPSRQWSEISTDEIVLTQNIQV